MRLLAQNLIALCLTLAVSGGNLLKVDLRTTMQVRAPSAPMSEEEENRGKQVEVREEAATAARRAKLRVVPPHAVVHARFTLDPKPQRTHPPISPDSHSDPRSSINSPLLC